MDRQARVQILISKIDINTFNAEDINTCAPCLSPVAEDIPVCPALPSLSKDSHMSSPFVFTFIVALHQSV